MGLIVSWVPADATVSKPLTLCNSSRSVAEHNVKMNNKGLGETAEPYEADYAVNFYRFNERNVFSFECERDRDLSGSPTAFVDPEAAAAFAMLHLGGMDLRGTGSLRVQLIGASTNTTLVFANAMKQSIDWTKWEGIAITLAYSFACGQVSVA